MASPAMSSTEESGGSGSKKAESIDEMLQRLGIEADEFDDLVFEEEESAPKEGIKWMALARVHTSNFFSAQTFEQHMKVAWSPAKEVKIHHIEGNLFTVQCFCLGDWIKVEQGGLWLFRQNIVCIEKYDGLSDPETIDLNTFATWIQIHKLPVGYRNIALIKNLMEKKVGKVLKVETDVNGMGNFVRARVKLDVRKALARFVSISREGQRQIYQVQYEKMPKFCGACGLVGHIHLECGTGEYDEDKLKWGDFLKADWSTWHGRNTGGNRRGGGRAGRGGRTNPDWESDRGRANQGGRGGAGPQSWRYNALAYEEKTNIMEGNLDDTATSPVKNKDEEMSERELLDVNTKRRLLLEDVHEQDDLGGANQVMTNGLTVAETRNNLISVAGTNERTKRSKKDGAISTSSGSAGSREDPVRSQ
jgi:hypothetical protein